MEKTIPGTTGTPEAGKKAAKEQYFFPALNGYRAMATLMVYLFHYHDFIIRPEWGWFTHNFIHEFHVGLVLFFSLSGFLITYRYYDQFLHPEFSLRNYAANRVIRIYPLYFILTTLTFAPIVIKAFSDHSVIKKLVLYALNITFLRGFFSDLLLTGIGPGWSLTPEECFYFSAPFIALAVYKRKANFFIIPAALLLTGYLLVLVCSHIHLYGLMSDNMFMLTFTFFGRSMEFIIGVGAAFLLVRYRTAWMGEKKTRWKTSVGFVWIIICIIILAFLRGNNLSKGAYHPFGIVVNTVFIPVGASLLLLGLVTEKTMLGNMLSNKYVQLFGKSSFAFYLIHVGFIQDFILAHITRNYIADLVILILLGIAIYKWIEVPISHWLKKKLHVSG
ncbi:acyltransferase family protein [Chitinophagaceae bacterium MMS25-I14]